MPPEKINLNQKFDLFTEHWSPKIVGSVDDYDIKIVKVEGEFIWHAHADEDELFLVLDGTLTIGFRDGAVTLTPGELIVIPKGIEHKPSAAHECRILVMESKSVINTGDIEDDLTVRAPDRI